MRPRPRRAQPAPIIVRVARLAGPAVAAGALITTVAVTAWPSSASLQAVPFDSSRPSSSSASASAGAVRATQADRGTRGETRPFLTDADEKAAMMEAAREKAVEEEAAAAKAAKRAAEKKAAEKKAAELTVVGSRYTTAAVKLRTKPSKDATSVDVVDEAKKIKVTKTVRKGYRLVVVDGKGRWITNDYLSKRKPSADSAARISSASCSKSAGIESGLVSNGVKVYRAMCAAFPQVSSFGGRRGSNDFHGSGQAVDAMISDSSAGWRLANWLRANASKLGVSEVIYAQKIWTVQRSGEGWRGMSDRGSSTANHYDHVHVSVY